MKRGIISGVLLFIAGTFTTINAQQWLGSPSPNSGIFRNGEVGIGGISPLYPLHILTTTSQFGNYGLVHTNGVADVGTWVGPHSGVQSGWFGTLTNHPLHFFTNGGRPQMTIVNGTGNVGINIGTPQYKLHTMGNAAFQAASPNGAVLRVSNNTSSTWPSLGARNCGIYAERNDAQGYGAILIGTEVGASGFGSVSGFSGKAIGVGTHQAAIGVYGEAEYPGGGLEAVGIWGLGSTAKINSGVSGLAMAGSGQTAYGVIGNAEGFGDGVPVHAVAGLARTNSSGAIGYGVYGWVDAKSGGSTGNGSYAGYFSGDVFAVGSYYGSDAKLKENIRPLENSLDVINKLHPKTYTFKQGEEFLGLNFREGTQYGLIAQDLEQVLPQLVKTSVNPEMKDKEGKQLSKKFDFKAVDYVSLIPILIAGVQEQQAQIQAKDKALAEVKQQLEELRAAVNELKALTSEGGSVGSSQYTSPATDQARLEQNTPNPFNSKTEIRYHLPQSTDNARICIFDMSGKLLMNIPVTSATGSITIDSGELNAGTYLYSLFVKDQKMDTKQMLLTK